MKSKHAELKSNLEALEQKASRALQQVKRVAEALDKGRIRQAVTEARAVEALGAFFDGLAEKAQAAARELRLDVDGEIESMPDLRTLIETIRAKVEEDLGGLIELIGAVARSKAPVADTEVLRPLKSAAAEVLRRLKEGSLDKETMRVLRNGQHPLAHAHALIDAPDELSEEVWDRADESVREAFGSDVRRAIIRGRVGFTTAGGSGDDVETVAGEDVVVGPVAEELADRPSEQEVSDAEAVDLTAGDGEHSKGDERDDSGTQEGADPDLVPEEVEAGREELAGEVKVADADSPVVSGTESGTRIDTEPAKPDPVEIDPEPRLPKQQTHDPGPGDSAAPVRDGAGQTPAPPEAPEPVRGGQPSERRSLDVELAPPGPGERRDTIAQLAKDTKAALEAGEPVRLAELQWSLIAADEPQLAFTLSGYVESENVALSIHPDVLQILLLGRELRGPSDDLARSYGDVVKRYDPRAWFRTDRDRHNAGLRLLLFAGCLVPTVIASHLGSPVILRDLHLGKGLTETYQFAQELAGLAEQLIMVEPSMLKAVRTLAKWEEEFDDFLQQVREFAGRKRVFRFAGATQVYAAWCEPGGFLHRLLDPILSSRDVPPSSSLVRGIEELISTKRGQAEIEKEIRQTDRALRRRAHISPIEGPALKDLIDAADEAFRLATDWVARVRSRPGESNEFFRDRFDQIRKLVNRRHSTVDRELKQYGDGVSDWLPVAAAVPYARRSLRLLGRVFAPGASTSSNLAVGACLQGTLTRIPSVSLTEAWVPEKGEAVVPEVLDALTRPLNSYEHAARTRARTGDLMGAHLSVTAARILGELEDGDQLEAEVRAVSTEWRTKIERLASQTRVQLEEAVLGNLLAEDKRLAIEGRIRVVEEGLADERMRFDRLESLLLEVRSQIERAAEEERQRTLERLRQLVDSDLKLSDDDPRLARVRERVEEGDLLTANEYIHLLESGAKLPARTSSKSTFKDFFVERFDELSSARCGRKCRWVLEALNNGKTFAGLAFGALPKSETNSARDMIEAWGELELSFRDWEHAIPRVLEGIGFRVLDLKRYSGTQKEAKYRIDTEVLRDRELCPVPEYGSRANGHYSLLCLRESPPEDELVSAVKQMSQHAVVVFYLGTMSAKRRRDLAAQCRANFVHCVVLDRTLLLFLCGVRGSRLRPFFECALPFTVSEPYVTTGSELPPEMFFGRLAEIDDIRNPSGTCLIYGGRQLGKTVLLREVERRFHHPSEGLVVTYIDLKSRGIGFNRTADEIWREISRKLAEERIGKTVSSPNRFEKQVKAWLDEEGRRRIVLLLDEADRFFDVDSDDEYQRTSLLKSLMESTGRRFKVVFAGLHNVQRSTRQANHPLAHFGEPRCIGPLLGGGDYRAAMDIIRRPLEALGYDFKSNSLPMRILSHTNYYPNLLQIFGNTLLRHMTSEHADFDMRVSPPFRIVDRHVEVVTQQIRDQIREKFDLTLQLDPRYEVLAYVIAHLVREGRLLDDAANDPIIDGLSIREIEEAARSFWSAGFRQATFEDIRALLEEMVGLGILRSVEDGRFTLRSSNVALLFGTDGEITNRLLMPRDEPLNEYDPGSFRAALGDVSQGRRSPLTARQEGRITQSEHGFVIVFGTPAAGLDDLMTQLGGLSYDADHVDLNPVLKAQELESQLRRQARGRKRMQVISVGASTPWTTAWVGRAARVITSLTSSRAPMRVVFVADGRRTSSIVKAGVGLDLLLEGTSPVLTMRPWTDQAVRRWIIDVGLANVQSDQRKRLREVTGNWPNLLGRFLALSRTQGVTVEEACSTIEHEFTDPERQEQLRAEFGLDDAEQRVVLRTINELPDLDDVDEYLEDAPSVSIERVALWAELLGLARKEGRRRYTIDPVVARLSPE